jgi:hypothetical protein
MGVAIAAILLAWGPATLAAASPGDYAAGKERIAAEYQAARQKCGVRHGHAATVCITHAHGARAVARAELKAQYEPSPKANYEAALARANATYANDRVECADQDGDARKRCIQVAAAARDHTKAEARLR